MAGEAQITIAEVGSGDIDAARAMLAEYVAWLAIDLSFQHFAGEVWEFPGEYVPPAGDLFIARLDGSPVGIVAFRRLDEERAEMKRLFVRPAARGTGLGRLLVAHVLNAARARGYKTMVLDTLPFMHAAQKMYEDFGFRDIPPYYISPIAGTRYLALDLS